jgi:hypothetical protein
MVQRNSPHLILNGLGECCHLMLIFCCVAIILCFKYATFQSNRVFHVHATFYSVPAEVSERNPNRNTKSRMKYGIVGHRECSAV